MRKSHCQRAGRLRQSRQKFVAAALPSGIVLVHRPRGPTTTLQAALAVSPLRSKRLCLVTPRRLCRLHRRTFWSLRCFRPRARSYGAACFSSRSCLPALGPSLFPPRPHLLSLRYAASVSVLYHASSPLPPSAADSVVRRRLFFFPVLSSSGGSRSLAFTARRGRPRRRTPIAHPRRANRGRPIA